MHTRRRFLLKGAAAVAALSIDAPAQQTGQPLPWYRRAFRWGQTNITEKDPVRYDIEWWRGFWKRTEVQAVIINAGGIVAYYPSKFPLHHRAEFLNGRDLFGELTEAAHKDGIFVMARMDSNRTAEDFFQAHPDWFARDRSGNPYRAADKYVTCINSPYYDEYLPDVLREISQRSNPDGFTDNSWAGLGRESICYCANCARKFRAKTGSDLPRASNWDDTAYRQWILWNYERRTEVWELNNRVTQAAGGPDCIWSGMMSGSVTGLARSFRDLREVGRRAGILMLDHQRRDDDTGFQQNGDTGKRIHGVMGWDKLAPESMAMYQSGPGYFRIASKPAPEARMWMISGIAGGIQPWWHYVAAYHEDRRMYDTPEPVMRWCKANESILVNREPVASVGVLWSQRNTDFFGRDDSEDRVDAPYTGFMHALVRARIPYVPVHVEDLGNKVSKLSVLILPNVGALLDRECESIRAFVRGGGSLVATGASSRYDEWGDPRPDYALADLFSAHAATPTPKLISRGAEGRRGSAAELHTYLRLAPELRAAVNGPKAGDEPAINGARRHAVLQGFDRTDILPYGGSLQDLKVDPGAIVPLTFVPAFPTYPPETAWMRQPSSSIAGLVLSEKGRSRVAFMPADIDGRYAKQHLPDHGDLLANVVRWAAGGGIPLAVEGPGMLDCHLYRLGPFRVTVTAPSDLPRLSSARLAVAGANAAVRRNGQTVEFAVSTIRDHEVVVLGS